MKPGSSIDVSWLPESHGPREVSCTAASLRIEIGDKVATRIDDDWSKSVWESTRVSAYPLALWIASSWWRLRWESRPFRSAPDTSWRMSHEVAGAGHGYLWPLMTFESDGLAIDVTCRPSNPLSGEPIRYLAGFRDTISASVFEQILDQFADLVLARLDASGIGQTDLHHLWRAVREERRDPDLAHSRQLEARLGFDPGEAPEVLMQRLSALCRSAGQGAVDELAPVCAGPENAAILDKIQQFAEGPGVTAHGSMAESLKAENAVFSTPWERGQSLARMARQHLGLDHRPISDKQLADALGVSEFPKPDPLFARSPLGLAIRSSGGSQMKLLFRKRNAPALRFEAARFLSEQVSAPEWESWLPATDTRTARQKAQRAFAAEFLCPIGALRQFLDKDFSPDSIAAAGEHFGVSDLAVKSVLANHREIAYDLVTV